MLSSPGAQRNAPNHHGRIAAGLLIGLGCFTAVVVGGVFIGQTLGDLLLISEQVAPQHSIPFVEAGMR